MKQRIKTLFACFVLALALMGAAMAGPLEDGQAALHRHDYAAALRHFLTSADEGNASAQYWIGFMYYYGAGAEVPQNYTTAAKWYLKAAEQGDPSAQADLGLMYANGKGVTQDYGEATKWLRLAADQGYPLAQYNLGIAYANALGVPQNYILAHMWLNLAVANTPVNTPDKMMRDDAARNRDILASRMTPEQIAEAQRLATEWKPK